MTRTIAIATQKGGSGKTTTAVSVAAALGALGRRVLTLDLDPQASLTHWFLGPRDAGDGLLTALLEEGATLLPLVRATGVPGVDVIPASPQLARAERHLAEAIAGEIALRRLLQEGLPADRWDYILIDCPPSLGELTIGALAAAGEVLVPVEASLMAAAGLAKLLQTIARVQKLVHPDLKLCGIFACRVDSRTVLARQVVSSLHARFPSAALKTFVRESIRLREAWGATAPINIYSPTSSGAKDYSSLALEIVGQEARDAALSA